MAVDIKVPSVGESISEGTLSRWLKKDGDAVVQDEPLFELETEKATTSVAAPVTGKLRITVPEGETVTIGAVVGQVQEGAAGAKPSADAKPKPAAAAVANDKGAAAVADDGGTPLSPAARRLAEEKGVDARQLAGTGRGGRIIKEDVQGRLEQVAVESAKPQAVENAKPQAAPEGRETRKKMSAIRQRIAEKLVASQKTTASLTTFNEADLSAIMDLRSRHKDRFKEKHGVGLGFMSFFVKAVVEAMKAYPQVNARIDGSDIVLYHYFDIGVAVSTEKGLMVPVLRDCDRLRFGQIEKGIAELADKARTGKINVADLQGGTFTITNGGVFGSLLSTPILNPPQSAILGMHTIQKRPVVVNDQVVIRPMMYLALTYDHRLIDGREAVQFLVRVKECVENPERLLLEV